MGVELVNFPLVFPLMSLIIVVSFTNSSFLNFPEYFCLNILGFDVYCVLIFVNFKFVLGLCVDIAS